MQARVWLSAAAVAGIAIVSTWVSVDASQRWAAGASGGPLATREPATIPPSQLRSVLDERARAAFASAGISLSGSRFVTTDRAGRVSDANGAAFSEIRYLASGHLYQLSLSFNEAEVSDGMSQECGSLLLQEYMLSCQFDRIDGYDVVVKELALEPPSSLEDGQDADLIAIPLSELDTYSGRAWYRRSVEFVNLSTGQHSSASDMIPSEDYTAARTQLAPRTLLADLAADPTLRMQAPNE